MGKVNGPTACAPGMARTATTNKQRVRVALCCGAAQAGQIDREEFFALKNGYYKNHPHQVSDY